MLAELPAPATLTIVEPTLGALEPIYDEVARVADAHGGRPGRSTVRRVDPASLPGGLAGGGAARRPAAGATSRRTAAWSSRSAASAAWSIGCSSPTIDAATRRRPTSRAARDRARDRRRARRADARRRRSPRARRPATASCRSSTRRRMPTGPRSPTGCAPTASRSSRSSGRVPARCDVVIVAGPATPLSPDEALALQALVARGGGLLVAAASRPIGGALAPTGLEGAARQRGPRPSPRDRDRSDARACASCPARCSSLEGYANHPVNAGFAGARATLWYEPRAVLALGRREAADPGVGGELGRARSRARARRRTPTTSPGPSCSRRAIAHASRDRGRLGRVVRDVDPRGRRVGGRPVARARGALARRQAARRRSRSRARAPDQVRLVMTRGQRRAVIALCTAGIPLAWILLGGGLLLLRRRRA